MTHTLCHSKCHTPHTTPSDTARVVKRIALLPSSGHGGGATRYDDDNNYRISFLQRKKKRNFRIQCYIFIEKYDLIKDSRLK